jgi:hypothetical protein
MNENVTVLNYYLIDKRTNHKLCISWFDGVFVIRTKGDSK